MSFTIDDFHDLIELLAQHPEWRAELRRHVLSDEILELPALVRGLAESHARAEARLSAVEGRLERVEARLSAVEGRLDRLEATVQALAEAQARAEARLSAVEARLEAVEGRLDRLEATVQALAEAQIRAEARLQAVEARLGRVEDKLGDLDGDVMEIKYERRGVSYLSRLARRLRSIDPNRLADLVDDALDDGRITRDERNAVLLADAVFTGRRWDDGQDVYLLVEVSSGVSRRDVERAIERAAILEKLGRPVIPVVAGRWINDEALDLASRQGVWFADEGRLTAPRSA